MGTITSASISKSSQGISTKFGAFFHKMHNRFGICRCTTGSLAVAIDLANVYVLL